jgi:hypothetical protein
MRPTRLHWLVLGILAAGPLAAPAQPAGPKPVGPAQPVPWPEPPPAPPVYHPPPPVYLNLLPALLGVAVAVYALKKLLEREEEEEVTPHLTDPTTAFEYKIIRSYGAFKRPDKFRTMLEEEGRAGWELFELLDHSRVRLRRPTSCRARDAELTQDPYRTRYGSGEAKVVLGVLVGVLIALALIAGIIALTVGR